MVLSLEGEGSGSLKRAREAVVVVAAVAGLAPGPGRVPAQGGRVGPALAQSPATGPGDLETRIAQGPDPGLEPGGQEAAAAPKNDATFWAARIHGSSLGGMDSL